MKKNILFIVDHLKGGGAERITLEVANSLLKKDYCVSIALLDHSDIRMLIPEGIKQINLEADPKFMQGNLWRKKGKNISKPMKKRISEMLYNFKPDIVFVGYYRSYWLYRYLPKNTWYWIHGDIFSPPEIDKKNIYTWIKTFRKIYLNFKFFKIVFDQKKKITVNSDLAKNYKKIIPNITVKTIYNGVKHPHSTLESIEIIWDTIYVGRLSSEKQPEHALIAFSKSGLQGRMAFVGDGKLLEYLKEMSKALGISNRVDFLGWQSNPEKFIQKSKTLILSSKEEGFGLVISEAIVLNVPVVSYACSDGVVFQMSSGELKKGLAEPQNIEDLSEKLYNVVINPYIIRQSDKERLSIDRMVSELVEIINDVSFPS